MAAHDHVHSASSCLIAVKHTASSRVVDVSSSDDVRLLSASGFYFRSFVISSASWLSSLLDIRLDSGRATWSWKVQPHPEFVILDESNQGIKSAASVRCLGVFLMPSVLATLEESLSSLSQWRAAVTGCQHSAADETTDHVPLKSLLLPLACVVVFETNLSSTTSRLLEVSNTTPRMGSQVFVSATPFASYCPEVFLNSIMSGCVSKLLGSSGSVFLLDASTVPGCEGGVVVHGQCSKSTLNSADEVCGMILSSLTSEQGQPIGLSLACSSSAIAEALHQLVAISKPRDVHHSSEQQISSVGELERLIVLIASRAGWGTGIRLTPSLVLTCGHVVHNRKDLMAHNTTTSEATPATVIFSSLLPDLALLKLSRPLGSNCIDLRQLMESRKLTGSESAAELCKGTEVTVIGFGLRHSPANLIGPLVSRGVVSKVVYDEDQPVMFVTTAAVNPGMSGGLVASAETGTLLGMVVSNSLVEEKGTLYPKINYCLPLSWLLPALATYVSGRGLLQIQQLEDWGQKVKYIWQLRSHLDMHPMKSKL